jgi:hypothetical protein
VKIGYKISAQGLQTKLWRAACGGSARLAPKVSHSLCELRFVIMRSGVHSDCKQKRFSRMAMSKSSDIIRRTHSSAAAFAAYGPIYPNPSNNTTRYPVLSRRATEPDGFMPQSVAIDRSACAEAERAKPQDVPEHSIPTVAILFLRHVKSSLCSSSTFTHPTKSLQARQ